MKSKLITRFMTIVAIVATLAFGVGNAFALPGNAVSSTSVISPYWQTDSAVYTFIGVSHTSLTGMNSEIGVVVSAMNDGIGATGTFGTGVFTVSDSTTQRIFIVATNHTTINSSSVTGTDTTFITGTTTSSSGWLHFAPRATAAATSSLDDASTAPGRQARDVTTLSYWGAIVIPSTSTGFAMEFIGDTHDSLFNAITLSASVVTRPTGVN